jgi:4-hydroxymandelate oxidase
MAAIPVCVEDFEPLARARIRADHWDYIAGGSGAERALAANRAAFGRVALRPRVLVDVSRCDTAVILLGHEVSGPIVVAPTAFHRVVHPEAELATARGAADAGALYIPSFFSNHSLEEIAAAGGAAPRWLQLYWVRDREAFGGVIDRAAAAGYTALVLTVDTPVVGQRLRDVRNGFALGADMVPGNVTLPGDLLRRPGVQGRSALADQALLAFDPSITWADLAWLRERSPLRLVLKGIATAEDAELAVRHGVDAIVVSNHGGRQLDNPIGTLDVLPEVADAVAGRCPVLVDGGVRTGHDVAVALALGADAVLVGRPVMWGLAVDGAAGVTRVLTMLRAELAHVMALIGRPRVDLIDRSAVRVC